METVSLQRYEAIQVIIIHEGNLKNKINFYERRCFPLYVGSGTKPTENPFFKLAVKIRTHHERMQTDKGSASTCKSYMSTETFYGSVDITGSKPTGEYEADDNAYDNASNRPMPDPRSTTENVKYINQHMSVTQPEQTLDTPLVNILAAPGSPRYDRVPSNMTNSQESSLSERIYAEVLDVGETTLTLNSKFSVLDRYGWSKDLLYYSC